MGRLLRNLALLAATVALLLASGEVALRILAARVHVPDPVPPNEELAGLPVLRGVLDLARPKTRGVFKGVVHRTNRWGFRGRDYQLDADAFRAVIVGDSFTMGSGVAEVDTYPHRLEVLMNVFRPQEVHEVLNLGLAGTNLSQSLGRLRHIGLRFAPDLIVYGWTHNDLEGAAYRRTRPAVPNPPSASLLVRWAGARWSSLRDLFRPGSDSYVYELDENYFRNTDAWAAFTGDLDRLAGITRDAGTCGVVFLHTALYSLHGLHPFRRYYRRVEEAARRRGLHVVESFEHFRGRAAAPLWVAPLDPHPNADGHRILARALFEGLEALPASCLRRAR